jgi:hypothetical protein
MPCMDLQSFPRRFPFDIDDSIVDSLVESKRERMKKPNCLSIQEKENTRLIYREQTILGEAEYHNRVRSRLPVPELGLPLSMWAGEAHGGCKPPA